MTWALFLAVLLAYMACGAATAWAVVRRARRGGADIDQDCDEDLLMAAAVALTWPVFALFLLQAAAVKAYVWVEKWIEEKRRKGMQIVYSGVLTVLKDGKHTTDPEVCKLLEEALNACGLLGRDGVVITEASNTLEFVDYTGFCLDRDLEQLVLDLRVGGISLEGVIQYWGDYDGYILVGRDGVKSIDREMYGIETASDEELIGILEGRGYKVEKVEKAGEAGR